MVALVFSLFCYFLTKSLWNQNLKDAILANISKTSAPQQCREHVAGEREAGLAQARSWQGRSGAGAVPLGAASIRAGRALLTRLPKGPWLCALALPADAAPTVTADLAVLAPARADVCGAVTVVPDEACVALAFSAVTLTVP